MVIITEKGVTSANQTTIKVGDKITYDYLYKTLSDKPLLKTATVLQISSSMAGHGNPNGGKVYLIKNDLGKNVYVRDVEVTAVNGKPYKQESFVKPTQNLTEASGSINIADLGYDSEYRYFKRATIKCTSDPFSAWTTITTPLFRQTIVNNATNRVTEIYYDDKNKDIEIRITNDMEIKVFGNGVACSNKQMTISLYR